MNIGMDAALQRRDSRPSLPNDTRTEEEGLVVGGKLILGHSGLAEESSDYEPVATPAPGRGGFSLPANPGAFLSGSSDTPPAMDALSRNFHRQATLVEEMEEEEEEDGIAQEAGLPLLAAVPESTTVDMQKHGYTMGAVLGMGMHGEVKKAVHQKSGREVAIKIIANEECNGNAWSEVEALRVLKHPHVVRLYDVIHTTEKTFLVLECLSGGELFDYLVSRQRLSEREGQRFVRQILCALDHSHKLGIVHRDLKLENLLLDSDGNIKVTDFGFSNVFRDGSLMSTFVGSPAYAAPEIIANEKYCGPAADIWSLGVIIFTIITGSQPFQEENAATNLVNIDRANYELPETLSDDAKDLISKILVRNPSKRLSVKQLWEHPWIAQGYDGPLVRSVDEVPQATNDKTVARMFELGYNKAEVLAAMAENQMSEMTASYQLIQEVLEEERRKEEKDAEIAAASARLMGLLSSGFGNIRKVQNNKPWNQPPPDLLQSKATPLSKPASEAGDMDVDTASAAEEEEEEEPLTPTPAPKPVLPKRDSGNELRTAVLLRNSSRHSMASSSGPLSIPPSPRASMDAELQLEMIKTDPRRRSHSSSASSRRSSGWEAHGNARFQRASTTTDPPPARTLRRSSAVTASSRPPVARALRPITMYGDVFLTEDLEGAAAACTSMPASPVHQSRTVRKRAASTATRNRVQAMRSPGAGRRARSRRTTATASRVTTLGETVTTEKVLNKPSPRSVKRTNTAPELAEKIHKSLDLATTMRGFGAATTSSLPAEEIMKEITAACRHDGVTVRRVSAHKVLCEARQATTGSFRRRSSWTHSELVCWEMEICLLAQLGLHGIRLHRVSGDIWKYKDCIASLMRYMKL